MIEYFRVDPGYSAIVEQEVKRILQENGRELSFGVLEKRLNPHPLIKIVESIPNDDPKVIDFNKKHLGFEVYKIVNGKLLQS